MPDRKPYLSERLPNRAPLDVFEAEHVEYIYADGSALSFLGPHVTKIELTRTIATKVEDGRSVDQRETFLRLTMPTFAVVELCALLLEQFGANTKLLQEAESANAKLLREA